MKRAEEFMTAPLGELTNTYHFIGAWLDGFGCSYAGEQSFLDYAAKEKKDFFENISMSREEFIIRFREYVDEILTLAGEEEGRVDTLSILPGHDKDQNPEQFACITLKRGSITALVGKTGSGKSRLLEDIEWAAAGDTPTGRTILLNGKQAGRNIIGRKKRKLIAQLSQNMNFVLDMSVAEFLGMHAACFAMGKEEQEGRLVEKVWRMANELSGEPFARDIAVSRLSGGQSRALMIADCAILSEAPVILIDEIENAGIDRRGALKLLTGEDKIVLIATHDPVLALLSDQRLVIDNGAISRIIKKSAGEEAALCYLEESDRLLGGIREKLRAGESIQI